MFSKYYSVYQLAAGSDLQTLYGMIAQLIEKGFFKAVSTEGRNEIILRTPVKVIVKKTVLDNLKSIYPPHYETGGLLWAFPIEKDLIITRFTELRNNITGDAAKTSYQPLGGNEIKRQILQAGALPIRFHSHPVSISDFSYDKQPLNFFQKTSTADRHNSYLPFEFEGETIVLPDGLLSANDREGKDIRFYLYGGLIAPNSLKAIFDNQKVYIYFSVIAILLVFLFGSKSKAWLVFLASAIMAIFVFLAEKRPTGVLNSDGDLIISFY